MTRASTGTLHFLVARLRDLLLRAVKEPDEGKFARLADRYLHEHKAFFARISPSDQKYFTFQLWQEGIA